MFDDLVADAVGARGAAAVAGWSRVESAACARRLAAMVTMLDDAHAADGSASRDQWCLDNFDVVAAHLGAVQRITSHAAANQLIIAVALHERFPLVAAAFADGLIDYRLVRAIVTRAALVVDPDALHALDAALAAVIAGWEPMSVDRTEKAIDALITEVDPHAVRRTRTAARGRSVEVVADGDGMARVFATLFATDATAFDRRVNALAATVCPADPRTTDQRRADAIGALAHGADRLVCRCDTDGCPAAALPASTGVVVYVIAQQDTLADQPAPAGPDQPNRPVDSDQPKQADEAAGSNDGAPDGPTAAERAASAADPAAECAALDGVPPPMFTRPLAELTLAEALTDTDPGAFSGLAPAAMMGGHLLPGAVARHAARGATHKLIRHPGLAPREPRYTPSRALAEFVRCRDLTCRFPGCHVPATRCDLDHTIAHPHGPTSASNLKAVCRRHHLLKTFWGGKHGWRDRQAPDGTVVWTDPDGRDHPTTPGSRLLFPSLSMPTAPVTATTVAAAHTAGLTMPRRRTTRAQDHARRIHHERQLNHTALTETELEATAAAEEPADSDPDPPPF